MWIMTTLKGFNDPQLIIASGGPGDDVIIGSDGADTLSGGAGQDGIEGRGGDDVITGGPDSDGLAGGAGADTFVYTAVTDSNAVGYDNLYDFETGVDRVDLTALSSSAVTILRQGGSSFLFASTATGTFQLVSAGHAINADDLILSGAHGVTVEGSGAVDLLRGSSRADRLVGLDGDDVLFGGGGADQLEGGAGQDGLDGGAGNDVIIGGAGADGLAGGAGADIFRLVSATDSNVAGYDNLYDFETGVDRIDLAGFGVAGVNLIREGGSTYLFGTSTNGPFQLIAAGRAINGSDLVLPTNLAVAMAGGADADLLIGGDGGDRINGGAGDDILIGGVGADLISGGAGADTFRYRSLVESTDSNRDNLFDFQTGVDRIDLSALNVTTVDIARQTNGTTLIVNGGLVLAAADGANRPAINAADLIFAPGANVQIRMFALDGMHSLIGGSAADIINGASGTNVTIVGGGGADVLTGGQFSTTFVYNAVSESTGSARDLITDFNAASAFVRLGGTDYIDLRALTTTSLNISFVEDEWVLSAATTDGVLSVRSTNLLGGGDLLFDEAVGVTLTSRVDRNLSLTGTAGDDIITSGAIGGALSGGGGADVLIGGAGREFFIYSNGNESMASAADRIRNFTPGNDIITVNEDIISASVVRTEGGDSLVELRTGTGLLTIIVEGAIVNLADFNSPNAFFGFSKTLVGSSRGDTLRGSGSADTLRGDGGDDVIIGDNGADTLFGGAGADTFRYLSFIDSAVSRPDTIQDFVSGVDRIDLSAVRRSASDTFGITYSNGGSFLFIDLDGNGTNDMLIQLANVTLTAADIIWASDGAPAEDASKALRPNSLPVGGEGGGAPHIAGTLPGTGLWPILSDPSVPTGCHEQNWWF